MLPMPIPFVQVLPAPQIMVVCQNGSGRGVSSLGWHKQELITINWYLLMNWTLVVLFPALLLLPIRLLIVESCFRIFQPAHFLACLAFVSTVSVKDQDTGENYYSTLNQDYSHSHLKISAHRLQTLTVQKNKELIFSHYFLGCYLN